MMNLLLKKQMYMVGGYMQNKLKGDSMTSLEQLKHEGILDLISQLGELTDDELEELVQSTAVGVA